MFVDRVDDINPLRIKWCCDDFGITPEQLASDVHISIETMREVLAGEKAPTVGQLEKIAGHFDRGLLFFLEPGVPRLQDVHSAAFRTLTNQKPALAPSIRSLIERVEKQRQVFQYLREADEGEAPRFVPPRGISSSNIDAAAKATRRWLHLGTQSTFDSYRRAVEEAGVLVFRSNGYNGKWKIPRESSILGFSLFHTDCPVIVVRKTQFEAKQTFTLMHELGHLLLHGTSSIDDEQDLEGRSGQERDANSFAGMVLVPDSALDQVDDSERPDDVSEIDAWLSPQRRALGVSGETILRRLLNANRISAAIYRSYRAWLASRPAPAPDSGSREWRHREPKHIFGEPFVRAVFNALSSERITLARASTYLDNLKISDLKKLESHSANL